MDSKSRSSGAGRLVAAIAAASLMTLALLTVCAPDFADSGASEAAAAMGEDLEELRQAQELYRRDAGVYAGDFSVLPRWSPEEEGYRLQVSDEGRSWLGTSPTFVGASRTVRCRVFGGSARPDFTVAAGVPECTYSARLCGLLCLRRNYFVSEER